MFFLSERDSRMSSTISAGRFPGRGETVLDDGEVVLHRCSIDYRC